MAVIEWPPSLIFCFLSARGENVIRAWLDQEGVPAAQRAVFDQKLDMLERGGSAVCPGLIFGPLVKDIYKLKIKGNKGAVQLRPMICRGPFWDAGRETSTLLIGAIERGGKLDPRDAPQRAQDNRGTLMADRTRRRHERPS